MWEDSLFIKSEEMVGEFGVWSLFFIILEFILIILLNIVLVMGNILVCILVYRNIRFWILINFYIVVLVMSDLLFVILVMFFVVGVFILGKWFFGEVVC